MPVKTIAERFWPKVDRSGAGGCWNWTACVDAHGYGKIGAAAGGPTWSLAHRVSYEMAFGQIPSGMHVCHRCDNRRCVNPTHLFLGTNADNTRDMVEKGRSSRGERSPMAKLTEDEVRLIRALANRGESHLALAQRFGVAVGTVGHVVRRYSWRHVA